MRAGRLAAALIAALVLVTAATWVAGEQVEVVVLRSFDVDGTPHETKLWVVDHAGRPWVRVAKPGRVWYQRLLAHPEVELLRGGRTLPLRAVPDPSPEARRALDAAFAARYGWTDAWYGLLLRRGAVPVRLEAREARGGAGAQRP